MKHLILPLAGLCALLLAAQVALSRVHCPMFFRMPDNYLCKSFRVDKRDDRTEITFFECDGKRTYTNPTLWAPTEECRK